MKRILLLIGMVPVLMSLVSCGKKENVTVEETTEAWEELSYLELDKTFTGEEFIGTYETGCMGAGGGYGRGEVPQYYMQSVVMEWPSLYADKDISGITATLYNTTGFFDDYKTAENAYYKRRNYRTGAKKITGSDENALRLIFMYDIPSSEDAWNNYMQSSVEEYRYMNECINKGVIELKAEYQDGSTGTDYYRIELYNQYRTDRINIYKLSEE